METIIKAANPVAAAQAEVCDRIGANIYGRAREFIDKAERGDMPGARFELLALLRFFPKAGGPETVRTKAEA